MPGTVEKHESIDIRELHRLRRLGERTVVFPFRWPWFGEVRANRWRVELELQNGSRQTVWVQWSACRLGGWRPWFRCPHCGRRVAKLYNVGLAYCRTCCDLRYSCQRRGAKSRRYLQALKLRLRLNGIASLREPFPERPRGMHRRTYARLRQRAERLERDLCGSRRFVLRKTDYSMLVAK
jgi:hypothetical protein